MKDLVKKIMENRVLTILGIFCVGLVVLIATDVYKKKDGNWTVLKSRDFMNGVSYYDQKIRHNAINYNPQVRIKTVYTGEGREFFINFITNFIIKDGSGNSLNGFSYVINQDELDCKGNKYKLLSTTLYDERDAIIYSINYEKQEWKEIPPRSDLEELIKDLCKGLEG